MTGSQVGISHRDIGAFLIPHSHDDDDDDVDGDDGVVQGVFSTRTPLKS